MPHMSCFLSGNNAYMHGNVVWTAFECSIGKPFIAVFEQLQNVLRSKDQKKIIRLQNISVFREEVIAFLSS